MATETTTPRSADDIVQGLEGLGFREEAKRFTELADLAFTLSREAEGLNAGVNFSERPFKPSSAALCGKAAAKNDAAKRIREILEGRCS